MQDKNLYSDGKKSWQKPVCGEKKEEINKPKKKKNLNSTVLVFVTYFV